MQRKKEMVFFSKFTLFKILNCVAFSLEILGIYKCSVSTICLVVFSLVTIV